jgi:antitoxin CptB
MASVNTINLNMNQNVARLYYRSTKRGVKENDILLGRFAERKLSNLNSEELELYGQLLDQEDNDIFIWLTGQGSVPQQFAYIIKLINDTIL